MESVCFVCSAESCWAHACCWSGLCDLRRMRMQALWWQPRGAEAADCACAECRCSCAQHSRLCRGS